MAEPASILITGASRGLGAALARAYAGAGVRLVLCGRDRARLDASARACRRAGAETAVEVADVTDAGAMAALVARADAVRPLDLVIANAGVAAGTVGDAEAAAARRILATNLDGVVNTVAPAITAMRPRRRGRIAIVSSLASFAGLADAPAYTASKAAVRVWGEALRARHRRDGIAVTVILPGFVRTDMTAGADLPMPMLMDADAAARLIRRRLARGPARIAFPLPLYLGARVAQALPADTLAWLIARLRPAR